jgi:hypothetical protein
MPKNHKKQKREAQKREASVSNSNEGHTAPSSTATALEYLKSSLKPTVYSDGIGIGGLTLRASNASANLAYLSKLTINAVNSAALLMSAMSSSVAGERQIYFSDPTGATDYGLKTSSDLQGVIDKVQEGVCDVLTNVTTIPLHFNILQLWGSKPGVNAELSRGAAQPVQQVTENCLKAMIQGEMQAIHNERVAYAILASEIGGGAVGAIAVSALLFALICHLRNRCCQASELGNENGATAVNEVEERLPLIKEQKIREPDPTFDEELQALAKDGVKNNKRFDISKVPEDYLCPVSRCVMQDPVVLADGHSADKSSVETSLRLDPEANCYYVREHKLKESQTPNYTLKKVIEGYVTRKKAQYTLAKPKLDKGKDREEVIDLDDAAEERRARSRSRSPS